MSRKALESLSNRCTRQCGTITLYENLNQNPQSVKELLLKYVNSSDTILHYYFILHDDSEHLHFHFLFIYNCAVRLSTTLNKLAVFLNFDTSQIGVEKLTNLNAYLRYFLHIDEVESKKRYDIVDIISDENLTRLQDYIDTDDEILSVRRLISLVLTYANEVDLMNYIGLTAYHKYRYEIKLLYENTFYLSQHYPDLKPDYKQNCGKNDLPF